MLQTYKNENEYFKMCVFSPSITLHSASLSFVLQYNLSISQTKNMGNIYIFNIE